MTFFDTPKGQLEIRELSGIAEMLAAEQIQLQVWGLDAIPHPKEILIPIQHEGGLLAGAFTDSGELVGLVFGFPTRDPAVQHSQLLATLETWRGCGIGARLKWYQREWCLGRGIRQVRWTVDPLRAANAQLNIRHLGATSSTYLVDYYGVMQGIDAGAPTDRLRIDWELDSPRVAALALATPPDRGLPDAEPILGVEGGRPVEPRFGLDAPALRLPIPADFVALCRSNPKLALEWRLHTRELFLHYFARGYAVRGFTRVGGAAYGLEIHT